MCIYKWPLIFLLILLAGATSESAHSTIDSICNHRNAFSQYIMEKTKANDYMLDKTSVVFEQAWNASNYKKRKLDCKFRVDGRRKNSGIFGIIRRLNLRRSEVPPFKCIDYVQLKYSNDTYSDQICGTVDTFLSFEDMGASIRVKLSIDVYMVLEADAQLEFSMIFTGYDDCSDDRSFSCEGSDHYDKCILPSLVKDGQVNCPPPGCRDEENCYYFEPVPLVPTSSIILSALTSLIFTMCGVGCCVYMCLKYYKCVRTFGRDFNENATPTTAHPPAIQPPIELQVRTTPRGSLIISPAQDSPSPTTDEAKDLPPSYDSLFPVR